MNCKKNISLVFKAILTLEVVSSWNTSLAECCLIKACQKDPWLYHVLGQGIFNSLTVKSYRNQLYHFYRLWPKITDINALYIVIRGHPKQYYTNFTDFCNATFRPPGWVGGGGFCVCVCESGVMLIMWENCKTLKWWFNGWISHLDK